MVLNYILVGCPCWMLNITLIITIETVRIPAADRRSALRNVMTSLMASFTRLARNNPSLFRLLPNSFRFSFDHHSLQRATHFLEIKGNRNQIVVAVDKWYLRVPSLERCILFIALLNAESSWIKQKTRKRTSSLFFTAKKCIRYPFGPLDGNDRFPATLSYTYFNLWNP